MAAKEETMSPASKATAAKKKVNPSRLSAANKTAAKRIAPVSKKAAPAAKKAAMTKKISPVSKTAAPAGKSLPPAAKKAAPSRAVPAKALPSKVASTKLTSSKETTTGSTSTKTASNKAAPAKTGSSKSAPPSKKAPATKKAEAKKAPATAKKAAPAAKASGSAEVPAPRPVKTLGVKPKPLAPVRPKTGPYAKEGKFLTEQTELLVIERDIYQEQATSLRAEADSLALEREPGDVQFDEESGEGGTVTVDRERNLALSGQAALAVEEIDLAMERVADKTYGYCERCYQPIPKPRLRALPYARLCVACKSGGLSRR
jgi:RNA polymerase-binding transcription factor DksA